MGLRLRLFLVLIVPLILIIGVYGWVRIQHEVRAEIEEEQQRLALLARAVQIAAENALRDRQVADIKRLIDEMVGRHTQLRRIRMFDRLLAVTLASSVGAATEPVPTEALERVVRTGREARLSESRGGDRGVAYLMPLEGRRGEVQAIVELLFLAPDVEAKVRTAAYDVLGRLGVLTLVLAALTALVLQRQVLRPLSRLMQAIQALGEGKPGPPLPASRRDELGVVAEAFNRMADQLQSAQRRLIAESEHTLELEQQLRQAQTLAVAGRLASGIAHEVGTPLNVISGRAEMVLRGLPADHASRPDLEAIVAQIDRISGVLRALLDTVRQQKPEAQRVALEPLVDRLVRLLDHVARRRGVVMTSQMAGDLPDLAGDPGQLQQVLLNLLVNALEATPRGGRVTVEAGPVLHDGRAGVSIAVSDTGSGIPPEAIGKIFQPFYTSKPPGQGTGLGLAICRDIVKDHGGTLTVQSSPGAGTTFTAWLPLYEGAA